MTGAILARRNFSLAWLSMILLLGPGCEKEKSGDSTTPEIRFTYPNEYTILSDVETIRVLARDNDGINHVVFEAEGDTLLITAIEPYSLIWNTSAYPDCTVTGTYIELFASVEDFSGNVGRASRKYFMKNRGLPPVPVELSEPARITKHTAQLSWDKSVDWEFSHYVLYRDTVNTVSDTSDSLVYLGDPDSTSFVDRGVGVSPFGLLEDTDYYYRVWVYDEFGKGDGSDSAAMIHTLLPQAPELLTPNLITKYTVGVRWRFSTEDVLYYRLHRGQFDSTALADTNFVPTPDSIAALGPDMSTYLDTGLTADTTYYYYLYLIDSAGYVNPFDAEYMLPVRTETIPSTVLRDPPQTVTKYGTILHWDAITSQEDSSWAILYRATAGTVDTNATIVYSAPIGLATSYADNQLTQGQFYGYRLLHRDSRDNLAWSNTVTLTTRSIADVWTGALGVRNQRKYELELKWDPYNYSGENDFAGYTLERDGQTVYTSGLANVSVFTDQGLNRNTVYNYLLTVADTSGATIEVSLTAATREIYAAELTSLEVTEAWTFQMEWEPSDEEANEFGSYKILRTTEIDETFTDLSPRDNQADCLASGTCTDVTTVTQQLPSAGDTTLAYTDDDPNLLRLVAYNYCVLTYDQAGEYAPSNIIGDTLLTVPDAVELSDPIIGDYTIELNWSQVSWGSAEADAQAFLAYEVWRDTIPREIPGAPGTSFDPPFTWPIGEITTTTYTDADDDLLDGAIKYYWIVVKDTFGQMSYSNRVEGGTVP